MTSRMNCMDISKIIIGSDGCSKWLSEAYNKTIAILIKLLAIKMVANSFLGRSNNFIIWRSLAVYSASVEGKSLGLSENSATSDPDISAEQNNKISNNATPMISVTFSAANILDDGGSKI